MENKKLAPKEVTLVCILLWVQVILSLIWSLFDPIADESLSIALMLIMVAITFWFTKKLSTGKNWMRIVILISSSLGGLLSLNDISNRKLSSSYVTLSLIYLTITILTIYLLYTKNSQKFFKL